MSAPSTCLNRCGKFKQEHQSVGYCGWTRTGFHSFSSHFAKGAGDFLTRCAFSARILDAADVVKKGDAVAGLVISAVLRTQGGAFGGGIETSARPSHENKASAPSKSIGDPDLDAPIWPLPHHGQIVDGLKPRAIGTLWFSRACLTHALAAPTKQRGCPLCPPVQSPAWLGLCSACDGRVHRSHRPAWVRFPYS